MKSLIGFLFLFAICYSSPIYVDPHASNSYVDPHASNVDPNTSTYTQNSKNFNIQPNNYDTLDSNNRFNSINPNMGFYPYDLPKKQEPTINVNNENQRLTFDFLNPFSWFKPKN